MKRKGFTLIELLVVIAIIGILAAIIIINLSNASERARYSKVNSELKTLNDAFTLGFADGSVENTAARWRRVVDSGSTNNSQYNIRTDLLDHSNQAIVSNAPIPPENMGTDGAYQVRVASASDHSARCFTREVGGADRYCTYRNGTPVENEYCQAP